MTRDKILLAARELFEEKGFDFTSVRDIAEKAEVNPALINYHFGSKELLLSAIIEEMANATHLQLSGINKSDADPVVKLQHAIDLLLDKVFANKRYYQMLHREISTVQRPEINDKIAKLFKRNRNEIRFIIEEGQKKKVFRNNVDIDLTLSTMFGVLHEITSVVPKVIVKEDDNKMKSRLRHHLLDLMSCFLKRK